MQDFIKINKDDNVAVALKPIANTVSESDLHRLIFQ